MGRESKNDAKACMAAWVSMAAHLAIKAVVKDGRRAAESRCFVVCQEAQELGCFVAPSSSYFDRENDKPAAT